MLRNWHKLLLPCRDTCLHVSMKFTARSISFDLRIKKNCILNRPDGYFWILCPWNKSADHTGGPWTKHYCTDSSQSQLLSSVSWHVHKRTNTHKYKRSWRMLYSSWPQLIPSPNNAACIQGQHSLFYSYSKPNEREGKKVAVYILHFKRRVRQKELWHTSP